ncbi:FecR family protein [Pedobacter africanus]|uniref:FecR family protein n=1 Tax=Pedobacter africanus TaxID=151894 RepID=A0A1W2DHN1_9SPHI|nr:FecR family protein [Pedobacter africanus]SMC97051.1 FecR family protein [Pedobacter africanus]
MEKHELEEILKKYHAGEYTEEERVLVEYYFLNNTGASLSDAELEESSNSLVVAVEDDLSAIKRTNWPIRIAAMAATLTVVLGIGLWIFNAFEKPVDTTYAKDIKPGTNKATLILPNGRTIELNDVKNGQLAVDRGVTIIKQADGQLLYQFNPGAVSALASSQPDSIFELVGTGTRRGTGPERLNTLNTPRGGQYHIALPDGTNVWLNAGSTLKFPSTFEGLAERRVLLIGEAYFEVSKVKTLFGMKKRARRQPFIVKTAEQEVTVLGTHFNINCYADEKETKTTLLEGSVGITAPLLQADQTVLEPGEQGVNNGSEIKVKKVNADEAVAWKNGYFQFDDVGIQALMRQFSRWYNIDVVYEGGIPKGNFRGQLPRKMTLKKALEVLSFSEISYRLEGKKIIIKNE